MRIAQVSHSLECGGSMALMVELSCRLARRGHSVDVICMDRSTGSEHERKWSARLQEEQVSISFLGRKPHCPGISALAQLGWRIASLGYDIVHSHLPMPDAMVGLLRRCGIARFAHVLTVHNTYEPRPFPLSALSRGANVAYCSIAARRHNPLPSAWTTVIPNGVDLHMYEANTCTRAETRRRLGFSLDAAIVVAAGRLVDQKNVELVIESASVLHNRPGGKRVEFVICGDGPQRAFLQSLAHSYGLGEIVHLLGNRTDLPQILSASDIFLSTSHYEGMPLTVLEALAAGLPCVLSPIEEHYEIASEMAACVFAAKDPVSMASALESLIEFPVGMEVIQRERADSILRHSIDSCAAAYETLYFAVCEPPAPQSWFRQHGWIPSVGWEQSKSGRRHGADE